MFTEQNSWDSHLISGRTLSGPAERSNTTWNWLQVPGTLPEAVDTTQSAERKLIAACSWVEDPVHGAWVQRHPRSARSGSYQGSRVANLVVGPPLHALKTILGQHWNGVAAHCHPERQQGLQGVERPKLGGDGLRDAEDTADHSACLPEQPEGPLHTRKMLSRPWLIPHRPWPRPLDMWDPSVHETCATHGASHRHGTVDTVIRLTTYRYATVAVSIRGDWWQVQAGMSDDAGLGVAPVYGDSFHTRGNTCSDRLSTERLFLVRPVLNWAVISHCRPPVSVDYSSQLSPVSVTEDGWTPSMVSAVDCDAFIQPFSVHRGHGWACEAEFLHHRRNRTFYASVTHHHIPFKCRQLTGTLHFIWITHFQFL